jgi:hypothetical protein
MENTYSNKIITQINQIESKYGNKIRSEIIIIYRHKIFTG